MIDTYLMSMESTAHFMGAVLIQHNGEILLSKGYGKATENLNNTPETIFQIASLTKQFTAAAIMKLYEENKVDLECSINSYLPSCYQCKKWKSIEVGHLLSHQSGISDYTNCDDYWEICKRLTPDKVIKEAQGEELCFSPGSDYCYSNTGYDLLGKMIEHISQMSYDEFIKKKLLQPAGMNDSGIRKSHEAPPSNAAVGYYVDNLKLLKDPRDEFSVLYSDGAMYSTVQDLEKWSSVLDGTTAVLSRESIRIMTTREYGLMVDRSCGQKRMHHSGSMAGFRSDFCKFPAANLTIIILGNNFDFVPEYLSSKISAFLLQDKPLNPIVPFPKIFNFSPLLNTFYWDECDDDWDDDEEEDYTFELSYDRLILQGDNPTECFLLSNGHIFNPSEGVEFQLEKEGGLILYNSDGEEEGTLYPD
jgi:CubicO group peptidase (beta-lactamase class C family)